MNTLTDVPYQMTVGGAFVYVCENWTWERGLLMILIILNNGHVCIYIFKLNNITIYINIALPTKTTLLRTYGLS